MYTREQIESGEGFLANGEWTLVYKTKDGLYVTASRGDTPGADLALVGGGRLVDGKPVIEWC